MSVFTLFSLVTFFSSLGFHSVLQITFSTILPTISSRCLSLFSCLQPPWKDNPFTNHTEVGALKVSGLLCAPMSICPPTLSCRDNALSQFPTFSLYFLPSCISPGLVTRYYKYVLACTRFDQYHSNCSSSFAHHSFSCRCSLCFAHHFSNHASYYFLSLLSHFALLSPHLSGRLLHDLFLAFHVFSTFSTKFHLS